MNDDHRERRVSELRVLQTQNPRALIERYRRIVGDTPSSQMPRGVSFSRMIDTIVDFEEQPERARDATS